MIRGLDPGSRVIAERLPDLIGEFLALDYSVLEGRKRELLNFVPNRWETVRELLDRRRPE
ncbi:MAG: hypothetical protein HYU75_15980 [Betaproteobacteria bacterium]|nr:hypothetical protein [Betaproteobacteria bacterium]